MKLKRLPGIGLCCVMLAACATSRGPEALVPGLGASARLVNDGVLWECSAWKSAREVWASTPAENHCLRSTDQPFYPGTPIRVIPAGTELTEIRSVTINAIDASYCLLRVRLADEPESVVVDDMEIEYLLGLLPKPAKSHWACPSQHARRGPPPVLPQ